MQMTEKMEQKSLDGTAPAGLDLQEFYMHYLTHGISFFIDLGLINYGQNKKISYQRKGIRA